MTLAEKIRYLREVEGSLRGLGRPLTQVELARAIRKEQGKSISQSYISQIEGGSRRHMTQASRSLLAKFFKVHPGFLVDDPEGYHTELTSDLRTVEGAVKGGEAGPAIVPGSSAQSLLFAKVSSGAMPISGKKLTSDELETIRTELRNLAKRIDKLEKKASPKKK